jgi:Tol biopolymer transport system component
LAWTALGPRSISSYLANYFTTYYANNYSYYGSPPLSGRVSAIATHPTNSDIAYVGGAVGGVWKTEDGGTNWEPVFDQEAPAIAIGSIAVDPNPNQGNVVYVGTGEANNCCQSYFGTGVYKSTSQGATGSWTKLGGTTFDNCHVADIVVKPGDSNTILVAVHDYGKYGSTACARGIYRTTNGGANAADWQRVTSRCRPTDLAVDPTNATIWYGGFVRAGNDPTECGVYKSTDSGAAGSWLASGTGLPTSGLGRVMLTVSPSDGQRLYAAITNCAPGAAGCSDDELKDGKVWKSTNGGGSWSSLPAATDICDIGSGGQCNYDLTIAAYPTGTSFYVGGVKLSKYNGDETVAPAPVGFCDHPCTLNANDIHVDFHALAFDAANRLWIGNDGGVYRTSDGTTFENLNANLALTQYYPGISGSVVGPLVGGAQDNGVSKFAGDLGWKGLLGADGAFTAVDATDPRIIFGSTQFLDVWRSDDGGKTVAEKSGAWASDQKEFIAPLVMDPSNSQVLYAGTMRVWKTTNRGEAWGAISPFFGDNADPFGNRITAIAAAPSNSNTIYVGTSGSTTGGGTASQVRVTTNGGTTDPLSWPNTAAAPFPNREVTDIAVHDTVSTQAYVTVSGFDTGHVFKYTKPNGVDTWTNISGNLPNAPANAVVVDTRTSPTTIYVGTDVGVFWTTDGPGPFTWLNTSTDLPNTVITDLILDKTANELIASTHGRGMFSAPVAPPPAPGGKIAFVSNRDGDNEIFVMSSTGTGLTKLTNNTADDNTPVWSPDRTKIAFATNRDGNYEIYVMNADGGNPTRLTNDAGRDEAPSWSQGGKIAFNSSRDGDHEIFTMNADGGAQTQLTANTSVDGYPSWSPDGAQIAFHSNRDGDFEVFKMNADGGAQTNLTLNAVSDGEASWSPDGTKIAFNGATGGDFEIVLMNTDGSGQTAITSNAIEDRNASWSPGSSHLTFNSLRDGDHNIFRVASSGGTATRLTSDLEIDADPSWQPAVTAAAPDAPTNVTAVAGNARATVSWTAPASDPGYPITNYVVTPYVGASPQPATTVGNVTQTVITGLTNGTVYTFKVKARNAIGDGPDSAASNAVTLPVPAADFDGDGDTDLSVWRPEGGTWYPFGGLAQQWGLSDDVPVPGQYDSDSAADIAAWRPSDGFWYVQGGVAQQWGISTDVPVPGDYDGDGDTEFAVWRPEGGTWYVHGSDPQQWGISTDVPVPGDYDGDGDTDMAVWRPSNGTWYVRMGVTEQWGIASDVPVPGQYDADPATEIAVWRPSNGTWYVLGGTPQQWGISTDVPVPGDYDGDGDTEFAVWRPSDGFWHVLNGATQQWGISSDKPLPPLPSITRLLFP